MFFFRLIRLPNLLIVVLTQYIIYYRVLLPAFKENLVVPLLDDLHFFLLVASTTCVTAAAYIINDILDRVADRINRPDRLIVGERISEQTAYWLYFIFNVLGFMLALYLAFYINNIGLVNIFPLAVGGLFFYSAFLKRKAFWGNLLVAIYSAGVPGLIWFTEKKGFVELGQKDSIVAENIFLILISYLLFAFFSTLMREIIKDIEDQKGDRDLHYATVPLRWGEKRARQLALFFGFCLFVLIAVLLPLFLHRDYAISPYILLLLILIPLVVVLYLLFKAKKREEYSRLSFLTKLVMLSGILLLFFI